MSTSCGIGFKEKGEYIISYCNSDGYPEYTGAILLKHYVEIGKIKELVALGYLSYVAGNVSGEGRVRSYDHKLAGVTVAFHRDRGDEYSPPEEFEKLEHVDYGVYVYIFDTSENCWFIFTDDTYKKLEDELN